MAHSFSCSSGDLLDFTESIPSQISEDIFTLLDVPSLCRATKVSTRWHFHIDGSSYVWRRKFQTLNPQSCCGSDLLIETSSYWKSMTIKRYLAKEFKAAWLRGDFSTICCYEDLKHVKMQPLTKDDWGEIFQHELDR